MSTSAKRWCRTPGTCRPTRPRRPRESCFQRAGGPRRLVTDDERLVGVVTRKTLVREVVAAGRDPQLDELGAIAEPPHFTDRADSRSTRRSASSRSRTLERVPVVDERRAPPRRALAKRLQRRLAEDEGPSRDTAGGVGAYRGVPSSGAGALPRVRRGEPRASALLPRLRHALCEQRGAAGEERKVVSVLFVDLVGFTAAPTAPTPRTSARRSAPTTSC